MFLQATMIVNHYSILMLFMAGLGLVFAAVLAGIALLAAGRIRHSRGELQTSAAEQLIHLAALAAAVCLVLLLAGWPLFYATLNSFVPEIPGAMCVYGVTRVMPATSALLEVAMPAGVFLLGAWLLLDRARRQSGRPPRRAGGVLALAAVAGLVVLLHGTEIYYLLNMKSLNEVSCCSRSGVNAESALQAPSYYLPWLLTAPARQALLNVSFFGGLPALAVWLLLNSSRRGARSRGFALAENAATMVAAAGLGLASWAEFSEVLAPLLMQLPFHHCLYCLVTNGRAPDAPVIVANLAIGVFCGGWAAVLGVALGNGAPAAWRMRRRVCVLGATALLACVLMVLIHLVI